MDGDLVMATQGQGLTQRVPRGSPTKGRRAPLDAADMQALDSEIEAQEGLLDGDAENGDQSSPVMCCDNGCESLRFQSLLYCTRTVAWRLSALL